MKIKGSNGLVVEVEDTIATGMVTAGMVVEAEPGKPKRSRSAK